MMRALILSLAFVVQASDDPATRMLNEWIRSVDEHRAGEKDAALARVAAWNHDELEIMRGYVQVFAEVPVSSPERVARRRAIAGHLGTIRDLLQVTLARGEFDRFRQRAAMLHTDAALLTSVPAVASSPVGRLRRPRLPRDERESDIDVQNFDGRVEGFALANPHWQFAMDLLEALPGKPTRDPIVARWYRAIGAYFARNHSFGNAYRHFDRARRIVPDDPGVLYGEACLQETFGGPRQQNFVRVASLPSGLRLIGVESPETHFRRAETLLKRALAARPDFVDARLRLGHVLVEQRQYDAALPHLARVVSESRDPMLVYYAHLFAGDAALGLDRPSESRTSYERALEVYPEAQAARLGLGAALRAGGDREAALSAVMTTLTVAPRSRDGDDDPWWQYYEGDGANVDRLLRELRAPFRSPAR
jgi:tetratricopeptide (TPR) repeat protein